MNFAAVFRLPVVFLCLNDGKSAARLTSETFAVSALAYGIAGVRVDGDDFLAVAATVREAAARARRGDGATLIEAVLGQGEPDGIDRLGAWLSSEEIVDATAATAMGRAAESEIRAAVEAEQSIGPPPSRSIIEHVWARPPRALEEQLDELDRARRSDRGP